jgi:hypothetical protein
MAKRAAKGQARKGNTRAKSSASKGAKKPGVASKTRLQVKPRRVAAAKSKAMAAAQPKRAATTAPPSTDIRRAYKSRLLAGYIGTHGADSIPSSKK